MLHAFKLLNKSIVECSLCQHSFEYYDVKECHACEEAKIDYRELADDLLDAANGKEWMTPELRHQAIERLKLLPWYYQKWVLDRVTNKRKDNE